MIPNPISPKLGTIVLLLSFAACDHHQQDNAAKDPVDDLLSAMTLEEKTTLLHGGIDPKPDIGFNSAGYMPGAPRLNIPPLRFADGPAGIRINLPATALPSPIGLAASFDPQLAQRYGEVIGAEGKARNQDVLLSPMVNIVRVPFAGRNFETFGEDPLLASRIVAAEITGIQSKGLMATVKHYIANNQEDNRTSINAVVDERTLREIYLPGFLAAVDAKVASVMCSYNRINGLFACENPEYLTSILRDEFSYQGFVMTDWWARHSLNALKNGLNLEMPGYEWPGINAPVHFSQALIDSVNKGETDEALIDHALKPILVQMHHYGFFDEAYTAPGDRNNDIDVDAHSEIALEVATQSAVLLQNKNQTLPLTENDVSELLVIGPTARTSLIGGGGSSKVIPFRQDSPLTAIEKLAGSYANISNEIGFDLDGEVIPSQVLRPEENATTSGLVFETNGSSSISRDINFVGDNALSLSGDMTWKGLLNVESTGEYELKIQTNSGRAHITIDGNTVANTHRGVLSQASLIPTQLGLANAFGKVLLEAGRDYNIEVSASTDANAVLETSADARDKFEIRLAWSTPEHQQAIIDRTVAKAENASAVVLFAYIEGTEGVDRKTLALASNQDKLITALAKKSLNKFIVVLNVGAPITMPWKNDVGAILQMWYPGQDGGKSTAHLLYGLANPSGKLPVTFPANETDIPTNTPLQYPGVDGRQEYSEGIFVGYRWYDKNNKEPLFPFGHGLSYSSFTYSDLIVTENKDHFDIAFTLTNTSDREGVETPQLYLGQSSNPHVETEIQKLVDFKKIHLAPGEKSTVSMTIDAKALSTWNVDKHAWDRLLGKRELRVGSSSRDIRLTENLLVR